MVHDVWYHIYGTIVPFGTIKTFGTEGIYVRVPFFLFIVSKDIDFHVYFDSITLIISAPTRIKLFNWTVVGSKGNYGTINMVP